MNKPWTKTYGPGVPLEIDADAYPSMVALFERAAAEYADHPAFECFGHTMTYAEVDRASRAFAAWLQKKLGVKRGDRIALMVPNVFAFPVAMLGIHRAGAAQVNVNPLYTPHELQHQLKDAGAEIIIISTGSTSTLAEIVAHWPPRPRLACPSRSCDARRRRNHRPSRGRDRTRPAVYSRQRRCAWRPSRRRNLWPEHAAWLSLGGVP